MRKTGHDTGDWSNGMIGVSKTFGGSSILSSPAPGSAGSLDFSSPAPGSAGSLDFFKVPAFFASFVFTVEFYKPVPQFIKIPELIIRISDL